MDPKTTDTTTGDAVAADTRRGLVRGAAAGSLLLLLGGARDAGAQLGGDQPIVAAALAVERRLLALYEAGETSTAIDVDTRGLVRRFAEQQREHVTTLSAVLGQRSSEAGEEVRGGGDLVQRAIRLEEEALEAYYGAHQRLRDASLVKVGAGIMANHGQRLVVLRESAGDEPVPDAFAGLR